METYILIAKKTSAGKFEDHRIQRSDAAIPAGYEKISGPATLDDCVRELKDTTGPNWFGLTVAQYVLIGVVTLTFVVVVVLGASKLYGLQSEKTLIPTTDDSARVFITFVIAVATVAIAFLAILTAMMLREYEKRFALAKEVLTILVGILGTIVGFYFGTANNNSARGADANANTNSTTNTNSNANGNGNASGDRPSPSPPVNAAPNARLVRRPTGRYVLVVDRPDERS